MSCGRSATERKRSARPQAEAARLRVVVPCGPGCLSAVAYVTEDELFTAVNSFGSWTDGAVVIAHRMTCRSETATAPAPALTR